MKRLTGWMRVPRSYVTRPRTARLDLANAMLRKHQFLTAAICHQRFKRGTRHSDLVDVAAFPFLTGRTAGTTLLKQLQSDPSENVRGRYSQMMQSLERLSG